MPANRVVGIRVSIKWTQTQEQSFLQQAIYQEKFCQVYLHKFQPFFSPDIICFVCTILKLKEVEVWIAEGAVFSNSDKKIFLVKVIY